MKPNYDVEYKPKFSANLVFAIQQLLAIIPATLLVHTLVNNISGTDILNNCAALFCSGAGTLFYVFATKKKALICVHSTARKRNSFLVIFELFFALSLQDLFML